MSFWKFGFHSQSAIDSILSSSSANSNPNHHPASSTPSTSSPNILLDRLLEEDDLLQEIKAQHPKLIEFLGTREVVSRMLAYISGAIFDDEDDDRRADLAHTNSNSIPANTLPPLGSPSDSDHSSLSLNNNLGPTFLNSFRTRVPDSISALLLDALDSEGRTPEDRAKAERRKVRFPYLCTEIVGSDLWSVTSQIFCHSPRFNLLTRFWDQVLDQPPSATAAKSVQIGYWAKTNIALINSKPIEMVGFVKSYPNLIPKLLAHFHSSPMVDVLMRIIQCEQSAEGTIDWLIDDTDFVELIVSLLHPSRSPELHLTAAEFLKNVIAYCTSHAICNAPPVAPLPKVVSSGSPPGSSDGPVLPPTSPDLVRPAPGQPSPPTSATDERPKVITTRLMRELSSPPIVARLLSFGLDTLPSGDVITTVSLTSSLTSALSILIDLIRRNNSDYSEHQLLLHLRNQPGHTAPDPDSVALDPGAPRVVPLVGLLNAVGDRLGDLQALIKRPRSSTKPLAMVVGLAEPLTLERFRIVELYAELLHCSNMGLVNRRPGEGPRYDDDGGLLAGLDALEAIFGSMGGTDGMEVGSGGPKTGAETKGPEPSEGSVVELSSGLTESETDGVLDVIIPEDEPAPPSPSLSDAQPAGMRMKALFIQHNILDTCFDLFFNFPWNNFLHNVIYDIVQQTLNAKFGVGCGSGAGCGGGGGEASLELAKSLFEKTGVVERILDGVERNSEFGKRTKNVRLGYMAHLVLIGEEVLKALETTGPEFDEIRARVSMETRWLGFVETDIGGARLHASLTLGGAMPAVSERVGPEAEGRGPAGGWTRGAGEGTGTGTAVKGEERFARYLAVQIAGEGADGARTEEEDSDEEWEEWDANALASTPATGSVAAAAAGGARAAAKGVISNPAPFGFDDRFEADCKVLPQRFADAHENGGVAISGFDDDFGTFESVGAGGGGGGGEATGSLGSIETEEEASIRLSPTSSLSTTSESTGVVSRSVATTKATTTAAAAAAAVGEQETELVGSEEEEEEWGEFSGAGGSGSLLPSEEEEVGMEEEEEEKWNDFDLKIDVGDGNGAVGGEGGDGEIGVKKKDKMKGRDGIDGVAAAAAAAAGGVGEAGGERGNGSEMNSGRVEKQEGSRPTDLVETGDQKEEANGLRRSNQALESRSEEASGGASDEWEKDKKENGSASGQVHGKSGDSEVGEKKETEDKFKVTEGNETGPTRCTTTTSCKPDRDEWG